jgi:hypothetical protein
MSAWGNTDNHKQKPKSPFEREVRDFAQFTVATGNTAGNTVITVTAYDGGPSTLANSGIAAGQYVYFWSQGTGASGGGQAGNGVPGMFFSNTTVQSVSGNTVVLAQPLFNTVSAGFGVEFDKAISYQAGERLSTYNQDTVLVTASRMANTVGFPNVATSHTGWVKVSTGTGGRAGRVQTEVLVALSSPVAANVISGNTSNSQVYYAGV